MPEGLDDAGFRGFVVDGVPDTSDFRGRPRRLLGGVPSGGAAGLLEVEVAATADAGASSGPVAAARSWTVGIGDGCTVSFPFAAASVFLGRPRGRGGALGSLRGLPGRLFGTVPFSGA